MKNLPWKLLKLRPTVDLGSDIVKAKKDGPQISVNRTSRASPNFGTTAAPTRRAPLLEPGSCEMRSRLPFPAPFHPGARSEWRIPLARFAGNIPSHRPGVRQEKSPPASALPLLARACVCAAPETRCSRNPCLRPLYALPATNRRLDISNPAAARTAAISASAWLQRLHEDPPAGAPDRPCHRRPRCPPIPAAQYRSPKSASARPISYACAAKLPAARRGCAG